MPDPAGEPAVTLPLPRAPLGVRVSPVQQVTVDGHELWLKREDRNAPVLGGNKVRALQLMLAGVTPGTVVLTLGGAGSTHVLATAIHAARLGARTWSVRWPHTMNPTARAVAAAIDQRCERSPVGNAPAALLRLAWWRARARLLHRDTRYIPFGGSAPAGIAGQVEAALELAGQVRSGELPLPARVVLPVGSGGTAAGLALGFALAGLDTSVVGVRVGPRPGVSLHRVLSLAARTRRWLRGTVGIQAPPPVPVQLLHGYYGGAYGRELPQGTAAARALREHATISLDDSYGAKAAAASLHLATTTPGHTLLWVTSDAAAIRALL